MFHVIIHGQKNCDIRPFLHITTDKEEHDKYVKHLQDDIQAGGEGDLVFAGEIDSVDLHKFWVMPFNK